MSKTNYDVMMEEMDESTLAMFIAQSGYENSCCYCVYIKDKHCNFECYQGIKEWLKSQSLQ